MKSTFTHRVVSLALLASLLVSSVPNVALADTEEEAQISTLSQLILTLENLITQVSEQLASLPRTTLTAAVASGPATTATFTSTTQDFINPERGWTIGVTDSEWLSPTTLSSFVTAWNTRVFKGTENIGAYKTQDLPASYLNGLTGRFAAARAAGVKMKIRFVYDYSGATNPDTTITWVKRHIAQLKPIIQANKDVIAFAEAGFIGQWGEWHDSGASGLDQIANKTAVRDAVMDAFAPETYVLFTNIGVQQELWDNNQPITASEAFSGTVKARTGFHNDCFMATKNDRYNFPGAMQLVDYKLTQDEKSQRLYAAAMSNYVPSGGETCQGTGSPGVTERLHCTDVADGAGLSGGILNEGPRYHDTYMSAGYYKPFFDTWKAEGCYDQVSRSLGYRFQLDKVTHSSTANKGDTVNVAVDLHNVGWSRIFSARKLVVTLKDRVTGTEYSGTAGDMRQLPPQTTSPTTITVPVNIPTGAGADTYDVYLSMPDVYATTKDIAAFAVRFANADTGTQSWDATKARFKTGTTVTVSSVVAPPPPPPSPTPTPTPTPPPPPPSGTTMTVRRTGYCITPTVALASVVNGTGLAQQPCGASALPITATANTVGTELRVTGTNWCIDVATAAVNGTVAKLWSCDSASDERYTPVAQTNGYNSYKAVPSGLCFDTGSAGAAGSVLKMWACDNSLEQQYVLTAALPAPTATLSASPTSIVSGSSATLTWSSTNSTSCTASNGWTGAKAVFGTQAVTPTANTTYSLACTGPGGTSALQSVTVTVSAPAPTATLSVSPTSIVSGSSATLTWSSTNSTSCTASNGWTGAKAVSGTQAVTPTANTTYSLTCTGAGGTTALQSVSVTVTAALPSNTLKVRRTGYCITPAVPLASVVNGTGLAQQPCGANALPITATANSVGTELRVTGTSWCIDVATAAVNGTVAKLWSCDSASDERYTPVAQTNGYNSYKAVPSGLCFDTGSAGAAGAVLKMWACDNSLEQQYIIGTSVTPPPAPAPAPAPAPSPTPPPPPTGVEYTGVTSAMWSEINTQRALFGDTNDCQARVNAIPTGGGVTLSAGADINAALANNSTVFLSGGTYKPSTSIVIPVGKKLIGVAGQTVTIDASSVDYGAKVDSNAVLANVNIRNARHNGVLLFNNAASDGSASNVLLYRISVGASGLNYPSSTNGTGIVLTQNAAYNCVVSTEVYDSWNFLGTGDPVTANGGNSDGYDFKYSSHHNTLIDGHAYRNADDGIDLWQSGVTFVYFSASHDSGKTTGHTIAGDGNGVKLGPGSGGICGPGVTHHLYKFSANNNLARGIDINGNTHPADLVQVTSTSNGAPDWLVWTPTTSDCPNGWQ